MHSLREHLLDDVTMYVGQATLETVVVKTQTLVIQTHQMKNGGIEIINGSLVGNRLESEFVTLPVTKPLLHSGPRKKGCKGFRVMITTGSVSLQKGHPSELRAPNDESVLKQTTAFHVAYECSRWLVHDLCLHGVGLGNVAVRIPVRDPVSSGRIAPVEKLDHPYALLEQAAGQDTVLGILSL